MPAKTKECLKCEKVKPLSGFRLCQSGNTRNTCKKCVYKEQYIPWSKKNTDNTRRYRLKKRFGISIKHYDQIFRKQNGVCAICKEPETQISYGVVKRLAVDHCHTTGEIRGLLCHRCNTSIGAFTDDISLLTKAIIYLQKTIRKSGVG